VHFIGTTKATIYVYGKVTYGDVFGNEWYTDYRLIHGGSEACDSAIKTEFQQGI